LANHEVSQSKTTNRWIEKAIKIITSNYKALMKFCLLNAFIIVLWIIHVGVYFYIFDSLIYHEIIFNNLRKDTDESKLLSNWIIQLAPFYIFWLIVSQVLCGNLRILISSIILILSLLSYLVTKVVAASTMRDLISETLKTFRAQPQSTKNQQQKSQARYEAYGIDGGHRKNAKRKIRTAKK